MEFNSLAFAIFFVSVFIVYYIIPVRLQKAWLLASSYAFYFIGDKKYFVLFLLITTITYCEGRLIEKVREDKISKIFLGMGVGLILGTLIFFKYSSNVVYIFSRFTSLTYNRFGCWKAVLPLGISFYSFQAVSYLIEIYRGNLVAERDYFQFSLFLFFFPKLVSGPIVDPKSFLKQLNTNYVHFEYARTRNGIIRFAFGFFLKTVVADNIAFCIENPLQNYLSFSGMNLFIATLLFSLQIYCDFNGYTQMAMGAAEMLGYELIDNFDAPYLSMSITEFWKKWHISLTNWFRKYLYIPLGGNRQGKWRKYLNILIVFACSGLWHGASFNFLIWGMINGLFIVFEDVAKPLINKVVNLLKIEASSFGIMIVRGGFNYVIISLTWLFFKMDIRDAANIICKIIKGFSIQWILNLRFVNMFPDSKSLVIVLVSVAIVFIMDIFKYRKIDLRVQLFKQPLIIRWAVYLLLIGIVLGCGAYGDGYEQTEFIYFKF